MKYLQNNYFIFHIAWIIVFLLAGCKQEDPEPEVAINHFSMEVDGQHWTPYQSEDDPCESTYYGSYGELGAKPFFTISAFMDPNGIDDVRSENQLRIQIMDVTKAGAYPLDGSYKTEFSSYITFVIRNSNAEVLRYVNDPERSPVVVNIDEKFYPKNLNIPGIIGSFGGILYNENDPEDSLTIENGDFNLTFMNEYHCGFDH